MKMPLFSMLSLTEIFLILLVLSAMVVVVTAVILLAVWRHHRWRLQAGTRAASPMAAGVASAQSVSTTVPLARTAEVLPSSAPGPGSAPPAPRACPRCGTPVAADSPQGLCPRCLLAAGFQTHAGTEPAAAGAERSKPPEPAELAPLLPQFEILELIGQGGMGFVYKARQRQLGRMVALKILPRDAARDPAFAERFHREARTLGRLNHPGIVTVYDFGETDGLFYLVMEYVDGADLRQLLRERRLAPAQALQIVPVICDALHAAHATGVVHRDIKPGNILIDREGRVKIADFGIAKLLGQDSGETDLTQASQSVGTPHYMAPEQLENPQSVDHRADIYSLGVVFYEMLTGELPLGHFPPPSRKVEVDNRFDDVVLRALEKEPARRYQQATEVKSEVQRIQTTPAPPGGAQSAPRDALPPIAGAVPQTAVFPFKLILGAVWAAIFPIALLAVMGAFGRPSDGHTRVGGVGSLMFVIGLPALLAPIGTTLLGILSIRGTRRHPSRLGPLAYKLARAEVMVFPLLACLLVSWLLWLGIAGGLAHMVGIPRRYQRFLVVVGTLGTMVLLTGMVLRQVRQLIQLSMERMNASRPWRRRLLSGGFLIMATMAMILSIASATIWWRARSIRRIESPGPQLAVAGSALALMETKGAQGWQRTPDGIQISDPLRQELGELSEQAGAELNAALAAAYQRYEEQLRQHLTVSTSAKGRTLIRLEGFPNEINQVEKGFWSRVEPLLQREQRRYLRAHLKLRSASDGVLERGSLPGDAEPALFQPGDQSLEVEHWQEQGWHYWRVFDPLAEPPPVPEIAATGESLPEPLQRLLDLASR